MKFHINEDGDAAVCNATIRPCPLQSSHKDFGNENDAVKWAEELILIEHKASIPMIDVLPGANYFEPGFERANESRQRVDRKLRNFVDRGLLSSDGQSKVTEAMSIAWSLHHGDVRRGTNIPYITHPIESVERLTNLGISDPDILSSEALHDVLEDASDKYSNALGLKFEDRSVGDDLMRRAIRNSFSENVSNTVSNVSNQITADTGGTYEEQGELYVREAGENIKKDVSTFLVKYSDFMDNAGTLKNAKFDTGDRKKSLAGKYLPLADSFSEAYAIHDSNNEFEKLGIDRVVLKNELSRVRADLKNILSS